MGRQSTLEKYGISKRDELLLKNEYTKGEGSEYSIEHENAKTHNDDSHPWGKGDPDNTPSDSYLVSNIKDDIDTKAPIKPTINTTTGGGSYDIKGRNGIGGREYLSTINPYNSENSYGADSVDSSINVDTYEQFIVK